MNRKAQGKMQGNEFVVKTIVTTELIKEIAAKNNIKMLDVYTIEISQCYDAVRHSKRIIWKKHRKSCLIYFRHLEFL